MEGSSSDSRYRDKDQPPESGILSLTNPISMIFDVVDIVPSASNITMIDPAPNPSDIVMCHDGPCDSNGFGEVIKTENTGEIMEENNGLTELLSVPVDDNGIPLMGANGECIKTVTVDNLVITEVGDVITSNDAIIDVLQNTHEAEHVELVPADTAMHNLQIQTENGPNASECAVTCAEKVDHLENEMEGNDQVGQLVMMNEKVHADEIPPNGFNEMDDEVSVEIVPEVFETKTYKILPRKRRSDANSCHTPYKELNQFSQHLRFPKDQMKPPKVTKNPLKKKRSRTVPRAMFVEWSKTIKKSGRANCPNSVCQRSFRITSQIASHYRWCKADGNSKTMTCPFCEEEFEPQKGDLVHHVKHAHTADKLYQYIRIFSPIARFPGRKKMREKQDEASESCESDTSNCQANANDDDQKMSLARSNNMTSFSGKLPNSSLDQNKPLAFEQIHMDARVKTNANEGINPTFETNKETAFQINLDKNPKGSEKIVHANKEVQDSKRKDADLKSLCINQTNVLKQEINESECISTEMKFVSDGPKSSEAAVTFPDDGSKAKDAEFKQGGDVIEKILDSPEKRTSGNTLDEEINGEHLHDGKAVHFESVEKSKLSADGQISSVNDLQAEKNEQVNDNLIMEDKPRSCTGIRNRENFPSNDRENGLEHNAQNDMRELIKERGKVQDDENVLPTTVGQSVSVDEEKNTQSDGPDTEGVKEVIELVSHNIQKKNTRAVTGIKNSVNNIGSRKTNELDAGDTDVCLDGPLEMSTSRDKISEEVAGESRGGKVIVTSCESYGSETESDDTSSEDECEKRAIRSLAKTKAFKNNLISEKNLSSRQQLMAPIEELESDNSNVAKSDDAVSEDKGKPGGKGKLRGSLLSSVQVLSINLNNKMTNFVQPRSVLSLNLPGASQDAKVDKSPVPSSSSESDDKALRLLQSAFHLDYVNLERNSHQNNSRSKNNSGMGKPGENLSDSSAVLNPSNLINIRNRWSPSDYSGKTRRRRRYQKSRCTVNDSLDNDEIPSKKLCMDSSEASGSEKLQNATMECSKGTQVDQNRSNIESIVEKSTSRKSVPKTTKIPEWEVDMWLERLAVKGYVKCGNKGCTKKFSSIGGIKYHYVRCPFSQSNHSNGFKDRNLKPKHVPLFKVLLFSLHPYFKDHRKHVGFMNRDYIVYLPQFLLSVATKHQS